MKMTEQISDEEILTELGKRLTDDRLARNLTQAALAEEAVSRSGQSSGWNRARWRLSYRVLCGYAVRWVCWSGLTRWCPKRRQERWIN